MRFAVDPWDPGHGTARDAEQPEPSAATVDPDVEIAAARWLGLSPSAAPARCVRFVDGVRRMDAHLWITGSDGVTRHGVAASYAAGVVCSDGSACIEQVVVRRGIFSGAADLEAVATRHCTYEPCATAGDGTDELSVGVQQRMRTLEALVAASAGRTDLLVLDGPLTKVPSLRHAVGYVKTHQRSYLPPELTARVEQLRPGERTPLFLVTSSWSRFSWYARLPGGEGHPWAGIVRGEVSADVAQADARRLADLATVTLPRFASTAYKDARAPQNLHPIAALERELRRRLGDAQLLLRSLRVAAAGARQLLAAP